jgi:hypothetical protein
VPAGPCGCRCFALLGVSRGPRLFVYISYIRCETVQRSRRLHMTMGYPLQQSDVGDHDPVFQRSSKTCWKPSASGRHVYLHRAFFMFWATCKPQKLRLKLLTTDVRAYCMLGFRFPLRSRQSRTFLNVMLLLIRWSIFSILMTTGCRD